MAGQYSILIGKNDSAEKFASKIKTIDPDYEAFLYSYASRFFQKGDFSSAKENVKKFIDENMKNVPAWLLLGQIDEKLGNPAEALDDFSTAVAFDPNNFLAGKLAKEIGSKIDAEKSASEEKEPENQEISGSQEVSLDEFGFGDDENSASSEEKPVLSEEKPAETAAAEDSSDDLTEGLKAENKTDVLKLDDENALFEDSEKTGNELDSADSEISENEEELETPEIAEPSETEAEKCGTAEKSAGNAESAETSENSGVSSDKSDEEISLPTADEIAEEPSVENEPVSPEKIAPSDKTESRDSGLKTESAPEKSEKTEKPENQEKSSDEEKNISSDETESPEEDETQDSEETKSGEEKAENAYENLVGQVSEILPKLTPLIGNNEDAAKFQKEIDLFKRLRQFGELLPFEQRAKFLAGRVRLLLDYIIARLSGRPGLLRAASEIRRKHNLPIDSMETAINGSNRPDIVNVLKDMESLTFYLEDKNLSKSLIVAAEEVIDKLS